MFQSSLASCLQFERETGQKIEACHTKWTDRIWPSIEQTAAYPWKDNHQIAII